jgi:hypothetical protein
MAIWIGEAGGLRIGRKQSERIYSRLTPSDVDVTAKRFGLQDRVVNLITGDRVWLRRVDESGVPTTDLLDFVATSGWTDNTRRNDGQWYVNVDSVGGIRLFATWQKALTGSVADAITLTTPASSYRVSYEVVSKDDAYLAQTVSWMLNTDRDTAEYTSLGDNFRQRMSTLVSGSGELDCFFDTTWRGGAPDYVGTEESAVYMHQLALRQEIGAEFTGVFLMKRTNTVPIGTLIDAVEARKELFYTADCVITSVATELIADQPIHSKISFITTGPIRLLFDLPSGYLLQEQDPPDKVLQESGFGILLELPS